MQQFMNRLSVNRDKKFCYNIVFAKDFSHLYEEICGIIPDFETNSALSNAGNRAQHSDLSFKCPYTGICIIADSNVDPLYAGEVKNLMNGHNIPVSSIVIPAGENNKNLNTVQEIYEKLIKEKFDRHALLIALGGGVVGDITGFVAATYLRGIDYIQVPTTLLAQADSSVGGKTGVDLDSYKNMIGAFKMPKLVYENVSTLKTLDGRQYASGFAEVMKSALIKDDAFYMWLIDNMYEILERDPDTLQEMLYNSDLIKKLVVEKDPYEKGERRLLNFGHTLGHAIEKYKNFELTHGECVSLGCIAAAYISWKKDLISKDDFYEIRDMFVPFGLPISVENIDIDAIVALTHSDKKSVGGTVPFILLKKVGKAYVAMDVTDDEMKDALKEIEWVEDGE